MRGRLISFTVAGFLIGALAGAVILLVTTPHGKQPVQSSGTALVGGPFSLVGTDGKSVTDADFRGRFMLVFPDAHCPTSAGRTGSLAQALDRLGDKAKNVVRYRARSGRDTPDMVSIEELRPQFRWADWLA
jgi:protein SCO1/2